MSLMLTQRPWIDFDEAASHASLVLSEPVKPRDLIQLALENKLTISLYLADPFAALEAELIDLSTAEAPTSYSEAWLIPLYGFPPDRLIRIGSRLIQFPPGVYDLPLVGTEKGYTKQFMEDLVVTPKGGNPVLSAFILRPPNTTSLYACAERSPHRTWTSMPNGDAVAVAPPPSLLTTPPDNARFVIRPQALFDFLGSLDKTTESDSQSIPKPNASTKADQSLQKLVIVMALDGYGYNPDEKRSSVHKEIADAADRHGLPIDVDTVRKWLRSGAELLPGKPKSV